MGGLGKTSLAKKLYNHYKVQSHFYCCAWVSVSQEYKTEDLLRRIIKSVIKTPSEDDLKKMEMRLTMDDLEGWLYYLLGSRRYLVVIDDVWDLEAWRKPSRTKTMEVEYC
ncbi:NB-ARC [Macleaya cordata]|uniref:NB-ARC n=1 Tax=Macleaya cordata TaxID=56857 RepID=A0A200QNH6_MACCD|nr:NB-ARC [Macleaya cordata]